MYMYTYIYMQGGERERERRPYTVNRKAATSAAEGAPELAAQAARLAALGRPLFVASPFGIT